MGFKARLSAPGYSNKYWYSLNPFYKAGYGLPNCTCYAWGRFYEILGKRPTLSLGNAEDWYSRNDGYSRGKRAKLGAVICWRKGRAGYGGDGAGHVAIVEKIYSDGSILISQSGWKSSRFWTSRVSRSYNLRGYVFQGFIYNPAVTKSQASSMLISYKPGRTYTLQANMKIRSGAGTNYRWRKRKELTYDGRQHALRQEQAVLKSGTRVTVLQVKKSGLNIWLKIPSGWVCGRQGTTVYIE